ncbi:MAG: hypothetical protein IT536_18690 [Hyphomicrobiales bacterium]|nr:hypothetical protein [Hyphomicrobiales bacterium]
MDAHAAQRDFVRDAIYVYNLQPPDPIASIRVFALIPARQIGLRVLYFGSAIRPDDFLDRHRPSALILTKAFDDSLVDLAQAANARGTPVVTALCDFHFTGTSGDRNRELCRLSKAVVVQTAAMAQEVTRHFGCRCTLIEEPIEYPRELPRFAPGPALSLLWYGNAANHDTLESGIAALAAARLGPINLTIVSDSLPDFMQEGFTAQPKDMEFQVLGWSMATQYAALANCDAVFIPSHDTPDKRVKGHNRVVEAINAGRLAIAYPLPQYLELADYCYVDADYGASIRAALADPQAALRRIEAGQRYIDTRFAPDVIADKWRALIAALAP